MLPLKPFYLIRHGESVANASQITAGGRFDSPLSHLGRAQASSLSPFMPTLTPRPEVVYHSPLSRARDTALHLNEPLGLPAREVDGLRERDMGIWDGLHWDDVHPLLVAGQHPPGGEKMHEFSQRVAQTLTHILTGNDHATPPLVVAHGAVFHGIGFLYQCEDVPWIENCQLHLFEPSNDTGRFPWQVWKFEVTETGSLIKAAAGFK